MFSVDHDLPHRRPAATAAGPDERYEFLRVDYTDPLGAPLLTDLEREYDARYGISVLGEPARAEILRYSPHLFAPPQGTFLLLLHDGEVVSGGAFMPHHEQVAEVKRVWTRADQRGRGLAGRVLAELERRALEQGYTGFYLTTGPRQPEARTLYLRHGYVPLFDAGLSDEEIREIGTPLPFVKDLVAARVAGGAAAGAAAGVAAGGSA